MNPQPQPKNKTVAQVLLDLGYCNEPNTERLPSGWREKAEKVLRQKGVQVHMTTIYEVRRKEAARLQAEKQAAAAIPQPQQLPPTPPEEPAPSNGQLQNLAQHVPPVVAPFVEAPQETEPDLSQKLTLADAVSIRDFAKKYGGLSQLSKVIQVIEKALQ